MSKGAKAVGRPHGSSSFLWLQGMICGGLIAFATPTALVMGVLLAPTALAAGADAAPGRPVARAVLLASAAFTLRPMWRVWLDGNTIDVALEQLATTSSTCPAWLAGAAAWAACQILPLLIRAIADAHAAARAKLLRTELLQLREAWDLVG